MIERGVSANGGNASSNESPVDPSSIILEGSFRKSEFVRLITQALYSLGYQDSAEALEKESNLPLQPPEVTGFCDAILRGQWDESLTYLPSLRLTSDHDMKAVMFTIVEQKFLELLEDGDTVAALKCLRTEIAPIRYNDESQARLHKLTSLVMCNKPEELREKAGWGGKNSETRHEVLRKLQGFISPDLLLPENRLQTLVRLAVEHQRASCLYHNTSLKCLSLLEDHSCPSDLLPKKTIAVLDQHKDEVWCVQFSHNGKMLASAGKDGTVIVWNMTTEEFPIQHLFTGHRSSLSYMAWSPDDTKLLTCGNDHTARVWSLSKGRCEHVHELHQETVTACAWFSDNHRFVTGGIDKSIFLCDVSGVVHKQWKGPRVNDLALSADNKLLYVVDDNKVRMIDVDVSLADDATVLEMKCGDAPEDAIVTESDPITSLVIASDSTYGLMNVSSQEIHLWNLKTRTLVQRYRGHRQGRYVIRSALGGNDQGFVISGSEDSQVYVWHRSRGVHLLTLPGHSGTVNDVSWSPTNPFLFASASDDHTVRIWGRDSSSLHGGLANGVAAEASNPNGVTHNSDHFVSNNTRSGGRRSENNFASSASRNLGNSTNQVSREPRLPGVLV